VVVSGSTQDGLEALERRAAEVDKASGKAAKRKPSKRQTAEQRTERRNRYAFSTVHGGNNLVHSFGVRSTL